MKFLPYKRVLFFSFAALGSFSDLYGYTSTDYYNAGLQLYQSRNYAQANAYFSAALQADPHNAAALQGRANCYYAQGRYPEALADYRQVQALQPDNTRLAAFIQALQSKVGGGSPAASGANAGGSPLSQGEALYQQRQYAAAVPYFQKAAGENPRDSTAFYYLGAAQMQAGDLKDAAVALGISNRLKPNPSVEAYVNQLKSRLGPDDQQWVDGQISASTTASTARVAAPPASGNLGVRLEPALYWVSLADFTAAVESAQKAAQQQQASDPTLSFNAGVPTGYFGGGVEPVVKLGPDLELGLPLALLPVGTVSMNTQDNNGNSNSSAFAISGFSAGLTGRLLIGKGDFQFFVAGGPLVCPVNIALTGSTASGGTTLTGSGNFSALALGGQAQVGLDWHLGDSFVVSPVAGYQLAGAGSFPGTLSVGGGGFSGSSSGQLEFSTSTNTIYFLASGQAPASGDRPLQVDLSGIYGGVQVSAFF